MMDILERIEATIDRATQDFDGRDELLRDAAVEIRRLRAGSSVGFLYDNEDTGREFAEQHPVESGEVSDATNVVPATAENLLRELTTAWGELGDSRTKANAEPIGYLKEETEETIEPRFIRTEERTLEWQRRVFNVPVFGEPKHVMSARPLRFSHAKGENLSEMRDLSKREPIGMTGDLCLVWVNQGDLYYQMICGLAKERAV